MESECIVQEYFSTGEISKILGRIISRSTAAQLFDQGELAGFVNPTTRRREIAWPSVIEWLKSRGMSPEDVAFIEKRRSVTWARLKRQRYASRQKSFGRAHQASSGEYRTSVESESILQENAVSGSVLEGILGRLATFKTLHPSFWNDPHFVRWQFMRLNPEYQRDLDEIAEVYEIWFEATGNFDDLEPIFRALAEDHPPKPGESFEEWDSRLKPIGTILEEKRLMVPPEKVQPLPFYKAQRPDPIGFRDEKGGRPLLSPFAVLFMEPPPIPYRSCFPLPYFIQKLPPWRFRKRKITRRNWGQHIVIQELSQLGVEDADIERLLLGIHNSVEFRPEGMMNPVLKVTKVRSYVQIALKKSYPLPASSAKLPVPSADTMSVSTRYRRSK